MKFKIYTVLTGAMVLVFSFAALSLNTYAAQGGDAVEAAEFSGNIETSVSANPVPSIPSNVCGAGIATGTCTASQNCGRQGCGVPEGSACGCRG